MYYVRVYYICVGTFHKLLKFIICYPVLSNLIVFASYLECFLLFKLFESKLIHIPTNETNKLLTCLLTYNVKRHVSNLHVGVYYPYYIACSIYVSFTSLACEYCDSAALQAIRYAWQFELHTDLISDSKAYGDAVCGNITQAYECYNRGCTLPDGSNVTEPETSVYRTLRTHVILSCDQSKCVTLYECMSFFSFTYSSF